MIEDTLLLLEGNKAKYYTYGKVKDWLKFICTKR